MSTSEVPEEDPPRSSRKKQNPENPGLCPDLVREVLRFFAPCEACCTGVGLGRCRENDVGVLTVTCHPAPFVGRRQVAKKASEVIVPVFLQQKRCFSQKVV